MIGVNLAGADFGDLGGSLNSGYVYPSNEEIDYYASNGMDVIRIPFRWERVQTSLEGPLAAAELRQLDRIVEHAAALGIKVVLDAHNFGKYGNDLVGSPEVSNASFANFWGRMADYFRGDPNVLFGLMNEPYQQSAEVWIDSANAAIDAIRASGATQKILVPGTYWNGAHSWVSSDNDTMVGSGVRDPLNNYAFEVHQYLDFDSSGTHAGVVSTTVGADRLADITTWARATGNELFLGEFGVAADTASLAALDTMLSYMDDNADVWIGGTYWAGGPWWGDYMFSIEPTSLTNPVDKPQMDVLERYDLEPDEVEPGPPSPQPDPPPPPSWPQPSPATIEMRRVATPGHDLHGEGDTMGMTFTVKNAAAGMTVDFRYVASLSESDFAQPLAADFARALPPDVFFSPRGDQAGTLTFTASGTYTFTLDRTFVRDERAETTDEAGWAAGNQEKADFHLENAKGGLAIVGDPLISNWVTDQPLAQAAFRAMTIHDASPGTKLTDPAFDGVGEELDGVAGNNVRAGGAQPDKPLEPTGNDSFRFAVAGEAFHYKDADSALGVSLDASSTVALPDAAFHVLTVQDHLL